MNSIDLTNNFVLIINYLDATKGVGHTAAALSARSRHEPVLILAVDENHSRNLKKQAKEHEGLNILPVVTLGSLEKLQGNALPMLVDNYALHEILSDAVAAIRSEYNRACRAETKLAELKSTLTHLAARL